MDAERSASSSVGDLLAPARYTAYQITEAFRGLSTLGIVQVLILMMNLVIACVAINMSAARFRPDGRVDTTSLAITVEFAVFTAFTIVYTVTWENTFAFYGLIFLQAEMLAFVTSSALIGSMSSEPGWARTLMVGFSWICVFAFLALQRVVRQTWGWHAYHFVGHNPANVQLYARYQQVAAAVLLDAFHSVFFITGQLAIIEDQPEWMPVAVCVEAGISLLLSRLALMCVREERRGRLRAVIATHLLGLIVVVYFAVYNTMGAADGSLRVVSSSAGTAQGGRNLVAALQWCCVCVRVAFVISLLRVSADFNGAMVQMFPAIRQERQYLIGESDINDARLRASSNAPRPVRVIETVQTATFQSRRPKHPSEVTTSVDMSPSERNIF